MNDQQKKILAVGVVALVLLVAFQWHQDGNQPGDLTGPRKPTELLVLILTETAVEAKYPIDQQAALRAGDVVDYLDSHCYSLDGTPGWRLLDNDTDIADEDQVWRDIMSRPEVQKLKDEDMPYIVISNGKNDGIGQSFPLNMQATLSLLKKWGGE